MARKKKPVRKGNSSSKPSAPVEVLDDAFVKPTQSRTESRFSQRQKENAGAFPFNKENYYIVIGGVVVLLIGFLLMVGGGSEDPNVFDDSIFSARRITVAPIVIMLGYGAVLYAILKKPKASSDDQDN